ncbi:MAG: hypothetical protein WCB51_11430 [Candidatus Dormiibacterota bacterium]
MLRQIARLTRNVPSAGPRSLAVAVYADAGDVTVGAKESGTEGVACVDDAARALELYCDLWDATRLPWTHRWCEGLLDFILSMQDDDGRWVNFILDWDGTPNRTGRTSVPGGGFWQSRALLAVARASRSLPDERIATALSIGLPHIVGATEVASDVRALQALTALTLLDSGSADDRWDDLLTTWSDEIASCRIDGMLMNATAERGSPHLWGHIQEGVLAEIGARLGRSALIETACTSADRIFPGVIATGFDLPRTQPYDVSSAVFSLSRLAAVTGRAGYSQLAAEAREWFDGRNPARLSVYDRVSGRVADGLDGSRISPRSGAEANIVAAQALFAEATEMALMLPLADALPAGTVV